MSFRSDEILNPVNVDQASNANASVTSECISLCSTNAATAVPAVKFCGLSHLSDIESANGIGPEYVGFILWDKSKRCITPELAKKLRSTLDPAIRTVGVFVDEDPQVVAQYVHDGSISVVQLHGQEDERYINELRSLVRDGSILGTEASDTVADPPNSTVSTPDGRRPLKAEIVEDDGVTPFKAETYNESPNPSRVEIWKAFEVESEADIRAANESAADFVLLDAGKGAGETFDWGLLAGMARPFGMAGGLDAETVHKIQDKLGHPALLRLLDVSSGIENGQFEDGRPLKDHDKMSSFAASVRGNQ